MRVDVDVADFLSRLRNLDAFVREIKKNKFVFQLYY